MSKNSDFDVIASNLRTLQEREAAINELRALEIAELAQPMTDLTDLRELNRIYRRYMPLDNTAFTVSDRIGFCRRLADRTTVNVQDLLIRKTAPAVIDALAYVKNQYSSEAYERLCRNIAVKGEHVFRSFGELCDDIETSTVDFCIMPIENTTDGKLINFYSIIDRFELKILRTCDIESSDGDQVTRYALLWRHMSVPQDTDVCYFEFCFTCSGYYNIKDILDAAALCNLQIYRIDSLPLRYNRSAFVFYPILYGDPRNISIFMLFLKLNLSQHTIVGIYNNI
ncbi:MAG: hypothetical protein IJY27_05365 [Clostridia bacterium]|nr:hypothetical protein [Clostridia bacterium]